MTSDVSLNTVLNQTQKTATSQASLGKDFNQFLTLLTTQLQNQDPMNPMDSSEFTNQLVQFSQVEQAINTNQKLDNLLSIQLSNVAGLALGYVGMDASYLSSELNFDGTTPVKTSYSLASQAATSKINIINEDGQVVYSLDGDKDAGKHDFTWDGTLSNGLKAAKGTYTIRIDALDSANAAITANTVVTGRVRGIETQNGVINLLVGERAVPMSNVLNASQPEATT